MFRMDLWGIRCRDGFACIVVLQLLLAGGRSTKASAIDEGVGLPRNSAGLNFHSLTTRMHCEVSEGILRTAVMLSALPLSSTLTRRTTVPVVTLFAGYCGNVAAVTSTGSGCNRAGPDERGLVESGGRGTFATGAAAGLKATATAVRDRTGLPSSEAGLKCQLFTDSMATSVSDGISRMGWTSSTFPLSLTVASSTTVPIAML